MTRKILSERVIPGKFHEIIYVDGFTQTTYVRGVKQRMQEWDQFGNLKSITTYKDNCLATHTEYDLVLGHKKSIMRVVDGVKTTLVFKEGKEDFSVTEYPDGRMSCTFHHKLKPQTKRQLFSTFQKFRG